MKVARTIGFGSFCLAVMCFGQGERSQIGSYHAKIVLEDGTELPRQPIIMVRPQMHNGCRINQVFGNGTVMYSAWSNQPELPSDECIVEIRLEGLRTKVATLRDGAVVTLKRVGESEGVVSPASSLNAPKPAAKAYSKGVEALRKGKWDEAQKQFEQAVTIYPEYAQAYSDLGEALEKQQKPAEAQAAFQKALELSPKYLKPYAQLARLAISQNRLQDALQITDRAVKLNATEFPSIYYYQALAHFQMHQLQPAEDSLKQAIELDVDHQMPKAYYMLGLVLEQKGDKPGSIRAFEEYVAQSPKPPDADAVKDRIARMKAAQ